MVLRAQRKITALVISLVVQVISLTGIAHAVEVAVTNPVTTGVRAPVRIAKDGGSPANFYVSDARAGGVVKIGPTGKVLRTYPTVTVPQGVAIGTAGTTNGKLLVSQGRFVSVIDLATGAETAKLGSGVGEFLSADGIAVGTAGNSLGYIFVVDTLAQAVKVYDSNGVWKTTLTSWAGGPVTTFRMPTGIAYEKSSEQIAVANGAQILFFQIAVSGGNVTLTYSKFTGAAQSGAPAGLNFLYATGVAFEYVGAALTRMYVVEAFQGNVQIIDPNNGFDATLGTGTFLGYAGTAGMRVAAGQLMVPNDAVFEDANNLLLVTNGNASVSAYCIDTTSCWNPPPAAPTCTINPAGTPNASGSLVITGISTNADNVVVSVPSPATVSVQPTAPFGTWSATVAGLPAGVTPATCRATNSGDVVGTDTESITFNPDTLVITVTPPPAVTNDNTLDVTGTVTAGAQVSCNAVNCDETGTSWVCKNIPLTPGPNTIACTATKTDYAPKSAAPVGVVLDTTAPVLTVSAIAGGSSTSAQLQNVSGTVTDANPAATVTVNGQAVNVVNGKFAAALVLSQGQNRIEVVAADQAGNAATSVRYVDFDFDFDLERPVVVINAPADGVVIQSSSIALSGTVTNADLLTVAGSPVTINGDNTWSANIASLGAGLNTIQIVATNSARAKTSSLKRTVIYDSANPAVAVNTPSQDYATNSVSNLVVYGVASATAVVTAQFNGSSYPVVRNGSDFTIDLPLPVQSSAPYPLVVTATDGPATTTAIRNILVDRTQPALVVDEAASTFTRVAGTSDADGTARIVFKKGDLTPVGKVSSQGDGSWIVDLAGVTYDPLTAMVAATDIAGNSRSKLMVQYVNDGDMNADRIVTVGDALICMRTVVASEAPSLQKLAHGDCAPVSGGVCGPDGTLQLADCLLILRRSVGLDPAGPLQSVP